MEQVGQVQGHTQEKKETLFSSSVKSPPVLLHRFSCPAPPGCYLNTKDRQAEQGMRLAISFGCWMQDASLDGKKRFLKGRLVSLKGRSEPNFPSSVLIFLGCDQLPQLRNKRKNVSTNPKSQDHVWRKMISEVLTG